MPKIKTILAIGSTGLGKTTIARLICEANAEGSSGIESATKEAIIYETDKYLYIDTRGFNDSFGINDEEMFHEMMRLLQRHGKNNIFNIDMILWFCSESERMTNHLQREANFIQRLIEYTDECKPTDLWNNVLIITKGIFPLHELVDGPKSAAKAKIRPLIPNFGQISVHFRQGKCKKCDAVGDPRLFSTRCHSTASIFKHSVKIEKSHPEQIVRFHSGAKFLSHDPDEISIKEYLKNKLYGFDISVISHTVFPLLTTLAQSDLDNSCLLTAGSSLLAVICVEGVKYYFDTKNIKCKRCKNSIGEVGCIEKCDNCKKEWEEDGCDIGYKCCKEKEEKPGCQAFEKCTICQEVAIELKTKGCTQYCAKCKETRNTPGCDPSFKHDVIMN
ncbi:hypothetical protein GLOIN_2v1695895 [Rhizophagus clarus]|uniref:G domain-containing protein n=1 Tax=Rhizophagus clarus TaxID=94130 RepID=A0A8H3MCF9_9GLOM|nr:hypothetical protein GLOIN_2v1695895 [Rhizophagus clarus]